jgi:hypothetical protein
VPHADAARGKDWPRRIGFVILTLTSLMVVAGIVTGAYRGRLFGTSTGWGAIVLPMLVLSQFLGLRRNSPGLSRIVIGLIGAPAGLVAAICWLMAVTP